MSQSKNRRNFLKLLLTGGAVAGLSATASGHSAENGNAAGNDKVAMLTEDGKLVEIDRELLERSRTGRKADLDDIHRFVKKPPKERS